MADPGGAGAVTRGLLKLFREEPLAAQVKWVAPIRIFHKLHAIHQLTSILKSLVSHLPSKAEFTHSRRFLKNIRQLLHKEDFDLILLNGSDLMWLLDELPPHLPYMLIAHNIEHQLFLSQIKTYDDSLNTPFRKLLRRDGERLRRYEMSGMQCVRNVIFLSDKDAEFAQEQCSGLNVIVIPPLFDYPPRQREICSNRDTEELRMGFLGNFGWWANRDGMRWFLTDVFPRLDEKTQLHIFGAQSGKLVPNHPRIIKHGFLPDINDVWKNMDFMICPIFEGGGVKVKLAEALYNGVPVLTTPFGSRGVELSQADGVMTLDSAEEWIHFLRSSAARTFRTQPVPESISRLFTIEPYVTPLQRFVQEASL